MTVAEQAEAQRRKEQIQREINMNKVVRVDTREYQKTEQEKAKLWRLKKEWQTKVANGYIVNKMILAGSYTASAE